VPFVTHSDCRSRRCPPYQVARLAARFPRAYVDVNREPYELDPELFDGPLPPYANTQSVRVVGGLGTVARIVADVEDAVPDAATHQVFVHVAANRVQLQSHGNVAAARGSMLA